MLQKWTHASDETECNADHSHDTWSIRQSNCQINMTQFRASKIVRAREKHSTITYFSIYISFWFRSRVYFALHQRITLAKNKQIAVHTHTHTHALRSASHIIFPFRHQLASFLVFSEMCALICVIKGVFYELPNFWLQFLALIKIDTETNSDHRVLNR